MRPGSLGSSHFLRFNGVDLEPPEERVVGCEGCEVCEVCEVGG